MASGCLTATNNTTGHTLFDYCLTGSAARQSQSCPLREAGHGFTLVELLVVVAIIGMLVALLVPATISARDAARRVQCINNQAEIGRAILHYETAKTHLPGLVGPSHLSWATVILPYLGREELWQNWRGGSGTPVLVTQYICPTDATPTQSPALLSYVVNRNLFPDCSAANATNYVSLSAVKAPHRTLMVCERPGARVWAPWTAATAGQLIFTFNTTCSSPGNCTTTCDVLSSHSGGVVGTFCDGHVEFIFDNVDWHDFPPGP